MSNGCVLGITCNKPIIVPFPLRVSCTRAIGDSLFTWRDLQAHLQRGNWLVHAWANRKPYSDTCNDYPLWHVGFFMVMLSTQNNNLFHCNPLISLYLAYLCATAPLTLDQVLVCQRHGLFQLPQNCNVPEHTSFSDQHAQVLTNGCKFAACRNFLCPKILYCVASLRLFICSRLRLSITELKS